MNSKAFELAISALVVIILGILVLIALAFSLTNGFKSFKSTSQPYFDTTESTSLKQACQLACDNQDSLTFCCKNYTLEKQETKCSDKRLGINCNLNCEIFNCSINQ
ncbi:MAG: hypothetical protein Q7S74_01770 [Nanoarchaeota archaeon]|nr:hypothetical protein [Nanoarchaeota archaeon]